MMVRDWGGGGLRMISCRYDPNGRKSEYGVLNDYKVRVMSEWFNAGDKGCS